MKYQIKEIFNEDGKNIKITLEEIFKNYCIEEIEKIRLKQ